MKAFVQSSRHCVGLGLCFAVLACLLGTRQAQAGAVESAVASAAALTQQLEPTSQVGRAGERAAPAVHKIVDWVIASGDNGRLPFAVIDKKNAKVFVFSSAGTLRGSGSALLGLAIGDESAPGIGTRPMAAILPQERTTPAGRFVASMGHNAAGVSILWVDYDSAISLHRVVTANAKEKRMQRLLSASLLDKRISYGCINVLSQFFDEVVVPTFKGTNGIVYVLPETRSVDEVFFPASVALVSDRRQVH